MKATLFRKLASKFCPDLELHCNQRQTRIVPTRSPADTARFAKYSVSSKSTHIATCTYRMLDVRYAGLAVFDYRTRGSTCERQNSIQNPSASRGSYSCQPLLAPIVQHSGTAFRGRSQPCDLQNAATALEKRKFSIQLKPLFLPAFALWRLDHLLRRRSRKRDHLLATQPPFPFSLPRGSK